MCDEETGIHEETYNTFKYIDQQCCTWNPQVILYHIVRINTPFKVWSVVMLLQILLEEYSTLPKTILGIYGTYVLFMWMGLFWYTLYWSWPRSIHRFFHPKGACHVLTRKWMSANKILFAAMLYYLIYAGLFWYEANDRPLDKVIGVWNLSISVMLFVTLCANR